MKNLFFLGLLLVGSSLFCQDQSNYPEQFSRLVQVPNSPEAEAFTQYGSYDVSMHTGTPNISVPLYVYKGREMDLPISLTYDASGIKVNQTASNVGLGWNLNIGGRVSRQTRGLPDHGTNTPSPISASIRNKVMKYRDYNGVSDDTGLIFDNSNINNAQASVQEYYEFMEDVSKAEIDIEQDYFSVNGMGLSDVIWMDTQTYGPVALKNNDLKVVSPLPLGTNSGSSDIGHWEFLDAQGNRYFFGNYFDGTEPYNIATDSTNPIEIIQRTDDKDTQQIPNSNITYNSSWLLSKVVSANGKDVYHFNYTNYDEADLPELPNLINQTTTHNRTHEGSGVFRFTGAGSIPTTKISSVKTFNTLQLLESVYHNGKEIIRFDFANRTDIQNGTNKAISAIKVYEDYQNSTNPVEIIDFTTSYFGDASSSDFFDKRLKLDQINMGTSLDKKTYSFDYFDSGSVPARDSRAIDKFGYFNNQSNGTLFGNLSAHDLPGANRSVSENHTNIGSLHKLHYPTGGYTEFEYENHKDATETYPGQRIKRIKSFANTSVLASEKEYEYPNNKLIKNFTPLTHIIETPEESPCVENSFSVYPATIYRYVFPPNMDDDPYITYQEVIEKNIATGIDNGYTTYEFKTGTNENWINNNQLPFYNYFSNGQSIGSLLDSTIKDSNDTTLLSQVNTYQEIGDVYTDKTFVVTQNPLRHYSYVCTTLNGNSVIVFAGDTQDQNADTSHCPGISSSYWQIESEGNEAMLPTYCTAPGSLPINVHTLARFEQKPVHIDANKTGMATVVKTEHFGSQQKVTTTTNQYDGTTLLMKATNTSLENGQEQRVEYTYPEDIPVGSRTLAEQELIDQNKKSVPLKTVSKRIDGGTTQILSTQETDYKIWNVGGNQYVLPEFIKSEKGGNNGINEDRIQIVALDEYGNTTEAKMTDGSTVSYIWGYQGRYPVAKIQHTAYTNIPDPTAGLDMSIIDNPPSDTALNNQLNQIRTNLPTTLVSTYTYEPLVGVTTMTDARGYTYSYHYDEHRRLKYVKDQDDKVLSESEYNYRINN